MAAGRLILVPLVGNDEPQRELAAVHHGGGMVLVTAAQGFVAAIGEEARALVIPRIRVWQTKAAGRRS